MKLTAGVLYVLVLLCASNGALAENVREDGNWWRSFGRESHVPFIVGFFQGMALGKHFSYWEYIEDGEAAQRTNASFRNYWDKFVAGTNTAQMVDGLDNFYGDYRNRKILVQDAVWLVLNNVAGTPNVEQMIQNWRRSASKPVE